MLLQLLKSLKSPLWTKSQVHPLFSFPNLDQMVIGKRLASSESLVFITYSPENFRTIKYVYLNSQVMPPLLEKRDFYQILGEVAIMLQPG